jgi:hypothetical protein
MRPTHRRPGYFVALARAVAGFPLDLPITGNPGCFRTLAADRAPGEKGRLSIIHE